MQQFSRKWFTLIELMVVVTIVSIISLATYIPYSHHQKKILLRQASREISQSLSDVRNLALNGLDIGEGNVNIGLYIEENATQLVYYASTGSLDIGSLSSEDIYKTKKLPQGIQVDKVAWYSQGSLFYFTAVFASGSLMQKDAANFTGNSIDIQISYKGADSPILQKNITYYAQSNISDY